uniref:Protein kinase domain-containing protein n=1 Tax=Haemonchus placei TaxID=6290 RepID=A0A0N4X814_HAEPC
LINRPLSTQLLRWIQERIPADDAMRIKSLSNYKEIQSLGKGRFGETVKRVPMELFNHWSQSDYRISQRLDVFIEEFRHLHRISLANDRIVNFLGLYADRYVTTIFLSKDFTTTFFQALKALNYLHNLDPPVVHRDIKAANLLLTISDSVKLANFGLVRDLAIDGFGIAVASDITLDFRGTLLYVAPEVLTSELGPGNRKAYGKPADVWALGCTLIEMLTKYPPHFEYFGHVEAIQSEILDRAYGDKSNWLPYNADVLVPTCSSSMHKLVDEIFERDPNIRPNTSKLCDIVQSLVKSGTSRTSQQSGPCMSVRKGALQKCSMLSMYFFSRVLYFAGILGKSVLYVISFLLLGIGTLSFFLFVSFCIVLSFRYLIKLSCECDLWQPQYIIISGILLILLFALLFSCCMVALGEYKYRIANKTLRESRFFVHRPQHDLVLCGMTILRARKDTTEEDDDEGLAPTIPPLAPAAHADSIDRNFYYK